jgi:hypothetical protein
MNPLEKSFAQCKVLKRFWSRVGIMRNQERRVIQVER